MPVDALSLSTTPVVRFVAGRPIGRGSGFFMSTQAFGGTTLCLVTCVHVLTGSAPKRRRPPVGETIRFEVRVDGGNPLRVVTVEYPLAAIDGKATWIASSEFSMADVAVVPIPLEGEALLKPIHCLTPAMIDDRYIQTYAGQLVHAIGYPLGWKDRTNKLPVWKSGHVASEPDEEFDGEPRVLIDITGRPGLSGAPVIAGHREYQYGAGGQLGFVQVGKLLGVYASNAVQSGEGDSSIEEISLEEASVEPPARPDPRPELGFIWKSSLLVNMLHGQLLDEFRDRSLPRLAQVLF
jgi:hypothetical protein